MRLTRSIFLITVFLAGSGGLCYSVYHSGIERGKKIARIENAYFQFLVYVDLYDDIENDIRWAKEDLKLHIAANLSLLKKEPDFVVKNVEEEKIFYKILQKAEGILKSSNGDAGGGQSIKRKSKISGTPIKF